MKHCRTPSLGFAAVVLLFSACSDAVCLHTAGYAYEFRFGSHLSFPSNSFLDHTKFTMSLWVRPYTVVKSKQALMGSESYELGKTVPIANAGLRLVYDQAYFLAGSSFVKAPYAPVEANRWSHIAGTFDSTENGGTARLYVNGKQVSNATGLGPCVTLERPFFVARSIGFDEDIRFNGLIDEVQLWSRALTAAEIAATWSRQLNGTERGLLLYLVGEGDTVSHALDRSANNRTATINMADQIAELNFFSHKADCLGCFGQSYPRCAPFNSTDVCGDGAVTGTEDCEFGALCVGCKCAAGSTPIADGSCAWNNATCKYSSSVDCILGTVDFCTNSCPCINSSLVGCLANQHCFAYDVSLLTTFAWPTCTAQCGTTDMGVCLNMIPDRCLQFRTSATCQLSNSNCTWCFDHCASKSSGCLGSCGNLVLDAGESCDDGNDADGDGCLSYCTTIEHGWYCDIPGTPCATRCSDGILAGDEVCDDGNSLSGDGCNNACKIESGWICNTTVSPTLCHRKPLSGGEIFAIVLAFIVFLAAVIVGAGLITLYNLKRGRWKAKKLPKFVEITLVSVFGKTAEPTTDFSFDLSKSEETYLASFPIKVTPGVLKFGFDESSRAPIDEPISDTVKLTNKGPTGLYYRLCPTQSFKWVTFLSPDADGFLERDQSVSIPVNIVIGCTTIVNSTIAVVVSEKSLDREYQPKHAFFKIAVETKLSTKLDPDELEQTENPIGDGSFGTVFRGKYRTQDVAIKILKFQELGNRRADFEREVHIMEGLRSPFIVGFIGAVTIPGRLALVSEFVPLGSFSDLIHRHELNLLAKSRFLLDTARGMCYLHSSHMMHRDLKPVNILVTSTDITSMVVCKLTDFGSTREVGEEITATYSRGIGTPIFMAPELLDGKQQYSMPADVYSFAMVLYETLLEREPYDEDCFRTPWQIARFITEGKRLSIPDEVPKELGDLITVCWSQSPSMRPTFDKVESKLVAFFREQLLTEAKQQGGRAPAQAQRLLDLLFSKPSHQTAANRTSFSTLHPLCALPSDGALTSSVPNAPGKVNSGTAAAAAASASGGCNKRPTNPGSSLARPVTGSAGL